MFRGCAGTSYVYDSKCSMGLEQVTQLSHFYGLGIRLIYVHTVHILIPAVFLRIVFCSLRAKVQCFENLNLSCCFA